jgi:hypothetical protein
MSRALMWPTERLYWAVLEDHGWRKGGEVPRGCLCALAEEIPEAVEDVHAVCLGMDDGRLVVCAARREDLEAVDADVVSVRPASLPGFVEGRAEAGELELLTGAFEPRRFRRAKAVRRMLVLGALVMCTALVSLGLERRARAWEAGASKYESEAVRIASIAVPGGSPEDVEREIDRLRERPRDLGAREDASVALASLLRAWPSEVASQPQSVSVRPGAAAVAVLLESEPGAFLDAFRAPAGWQLEDPRVSNARGAWKVSLELIRQVEP